MTCLRQETLSLTLRFIKLRFPIDIFQAGYPQLDPPFGFRLDYFFKIFWQVNLSCLQPCVLIITFCMISLLQYLWRHNNQRTKLLILQIGCYNINNHKSFTLRVLKAFTYLEEGRNTDRGGGTNYRNKSFSYNPFYVPLIYVSLKELIL